MPNPKFNVHTAIDLLIDQGIKNGVNYSVDSLHKPLYLAQGVHMAREDEQLFKSSFFYVNHHRYWGLVNQNAIDRFEAFTGSLTEKHIQRGKDLSIWNGSERLKSIELSQEIYRSLHEHQFTKFRPGSKYFGLFHCADIKTNCAKVAPFLDEMDMMKAFKEWLPLWREAMEKDISYE